MHAPTQCLFHWPFGECVLRATVPLRRAYAQALPHRGRVTAIRRKAPKASKGAYRFQLLFNHLYRMKYLTLCLGLALSFANLTPLHAQPERRLHHTFVPYQWEIYNTVYTRRYWDWRDHYDYITFKEDNTFKRKYQDTDMSGTWSYDRANDQITLKVTKPFQTLITLKVERLSGGKLVYRSSEENFKVTMYMQEGIVPVRIRERPRRSPIDN